MSEQRRRREQVSARLDPDVVAVIEEVAAIERRPVPPKLTPVEVSEAIKSLLSESEAAMGLPAGTGTDAERLRATEYTDQLRAKALMHVLCRCEAALALPIGR